MDLKDKAAVEKAVLELKNRFAHTDPRFLVQKYLPGGKELIVGAKAENELQRHVIMAGMGGIYVEVFNDISFKLSPVTDCEADEMLSSLKIAPLLDGVRGEKAVDRKAIVEVIQRVSQLVTDIPEIREMDLNPVMAFENRVVVVDARISL